MEKCYFHQDILKYTFELESQYCNAVCSINMFTSGYPTVSISNWPMSTLTVCRI